MRRKSLNICSYIILKKTTKKNNLHTEIVFHRHHYKLVACKLENYLILPFLVQCQVCIHGIMPLRDAVACGGACPQEYFFAHTTLVCCSTALTSPLLLFSWYAAHIKRCAPAQDSLESQTDSLKRATVDLLCFGYKTSLQEFKSNNPTSFTVLTVAVIQRNNQKKQLYIENWGCLCSGPQCQQDAAPDKCHCSAKVYF